MIGKCIIINSCQELSLLKGMVAVAVWASILKMFSMIAYTSSYHRFWCQRSFLKMLFFITKNFHVNSEIFLVNAYKARFKLPVCLRILAWRSVITHFVLLVYIISVSCINLCKLFCVEYRGRGRWNGYLSLLTAVMMSFRSTETCVLKVFFMRLKTVDSTYVALDPGETVSGCNHYFVVSTTCKNDKLLNGVHLFVARGWRKGLTFTLKAKDLDGVCPWGKYM